MYHPVFFGLSHLGPMNKSAMSGRCHEETSRMEGFLKNEFGMRNVPGVWFVDGVMAFELDKRIEHMSNDQLFVFKDQPREEEEEGTFASLLSFGKKKKQAPPPSSSSASCEWRMTASEVREWQQSFRLFYLSSYYSKKHSLGMLRDTMCGQSEKGEAAFGMKFVVRAAQTPIVCDFDGVVIDRKVGDAAASRCWLLSVTGIDFAARHHDEEDIRRYVKNWRRVFYLNNPNEIAYPNGRDFVYKRNEALDMDWELLDADLQAMVKMRLFTADACGVQVVIETGIGLGVFSGDQFGIGEEVRTRSARALRHVLETEHHRFSSVQCVVCALPIFRKGDNYFYFERVFVGYSGPIPVLLVDQDMHKLARTSASLGFVTSELNPADSHGIFGEYWQNRGPGTEEKLALTTLGLLTQHHGVNPLVLDMDRYFPLDVNAYDGHQTSNASLSSSSSAHSTNSKENSSS